MNKGLVGAGAALIALGVVGWVIVFVNPLAGLALCFLGPTLLAVGLVMVILGVVLPLITQSASTSFCPACGRVRLLFTDGVRRCPACGH